MNDPGNGEAFVVMYIDPTLTNVLGDAPEDPDCATLHVREKAIENPTGRLLALSTKLLSVKSLLGVKGIYTGLRVNSDNFSAASFIVQMQ